MAAVPADMQGPSDADLIEAVRGGRIAAYGTLYERHVSCAHNLARQMSRSIAEADDLVSEAFARVLDVLRAGRGPDVAFRAYLLTTLRHIAYDKTRSDRKLELTDDVSTVAGLNIATFSQPFHDPALAGLERCLAARAFARLPERWQMVLWHLEIEGQSPAEVGQLVGMTRNAVSALAGRAREGLREAYLQVHLADTTAGRCRATAELLGAWTRGGLSRRAAVQVETHLDHCARCRALAAELADVNAGLRVVAVLVLGAGATGYLAATAKTAGGTAAVVGTGGSSGVAVGSLSHQFTGVGASVAALAAAVVIAVIGSGGQSIPATAMPGSPTAPAVPLLSGSLTGSLTASVVPPPDDSTRSASPTTPSSSPGAAPDVPGPAGPAGATPLAGPVACTPQSGCAAPCPSGIHANFRWHYSANGSAGGWSATRSVPCPGSLSMGPQTMEGDLRVTPGATLRAGYDFTLPGNKTPLTLTVGAPRVVFVVRCVSGAAPSASTITVVMLGESYPVTNDQWTPSGDQHSSLVYQGSTVVPDLCGGGAVRLDQGGTFTATLG